MSPPALHQIHLRSILFIITADRVTCTFNCKACNFLLFQLLLRILKCKMLYKLFVAQRHRFGGGSITIIFIRKAHLLCIYGRDPMVAAQ